MNNIIATIDMLKKLQYDEKAASKIVSELSKLANDRRKRYCAINEIYAESIQSEEKRHSDSVLKLQSERDNSSLEANHQFDSELLRVFTSTIENHFRANDGGGEQKE